MLIVDPDARSLRVLEVSLRKAGFDVRTASDLETAVREASALAPDLLVADVDLGEASGFELADQVRERADRDVGVVLLSEEAGVATKLKAIESGADDLLAKPVLVKEVIARLQATLARRERTTGGASASRRGALAHMGVVDLVQVMEVGHKSGLVHLSSNPARSGGYARGEARGTLYFREGRLVDAQLGALSGTEAFYRTLLWEDGDFEIELCPIDRPDLVETDTQSLLMEGMRRVDEWSRLVERLPSMGTQPTVDYAALGRRFGELPEEVRAVVHLLDGQRTLFEVIDAAPCDDSAAIGIVQRLLDEGVVVVPGPEEAPGAAASLEAWLAGEELALPSDVPSALGQAMIPSPHSPSEILAAAELPPEASEIPEPTEAPPTRTPSIVLSRRTVPANRPSSTAEAPPPSETIEPVARPPKLSVQRVSSIVHAASPLPQRVDEAEATVESPVPAALARSMSSSRPLAEIGGVAPAAAPVARPRAAEPARTKANNGNGHGQATAAPAVAAAAEATPTMAPGPAARPAAPIPTEPTRPNPASAGGATTNGHTREGGEAAEASFFEPPNKASEDDFAWATAPPRTALERFAPFGVVAALALVIAFFVMITNDEERRRPSRGGEPSVVSSGDEPRAATGAPTPAAAEGVDERAEAGATAPAVTATGDGTKDGEAAAEPPTEGGEAQAGPPGGPSASGPASAGGGAKAAGDRAAPASKREATKALPLPDREPVRARSGEVEQVLEGAEEALRAEDFPAAASRFKQALALDRAVAPAHSGLAYAMLGGNEFDGARRQALKALRIDERDARANLILGAIAQERGEIEEACRRYRRYLDLGGGPRTSEIQSIVDQVCSR